MKDRKKHKRIILFGIVGAVLSSLYTSVTYWMLFVPNPCSLPDHNPMCGFGEGMHLYILNIHLWPFGETIGFLLNGLSTAAYAICLSFIAGLVYGVIIGWIFSLKD
jgi:hypothetical protein